MILIYNAPTPISNAGRPTVCRSASTVTASWTVLGVTTREPSVRHLHALAFTGATVIGLVFTHMTFATINSTVLVETTSYTVYYPALLVNVNVRATNSHVHKQSPILLVVIHLYVI